MSLDALVNFFEHDLVIDSFLTKMLIYVNGTSSLALIRRYPDVVVVLHGYNQCPWCLLYLQLKILPLWLRAPMYPEIDSNKI